MTTKRVKKQVYTCKTVEDLEQVMAEYATADAKASKITATMDEQITAIRNKYADQLQEQCDIKEEKIAEMQHFAESNAQLFDKKKSLLTLHGIIGFRTGTPKLKLLKKYTWGAVTEMLKEYLPDYVRTVEEPAKDKLLADRSLEEVSEHFKRCGIEVVQDESFYVELNKEVVR